MAARNHRWSTSTENTGGRPLCISASPPYGNKGVHPTGILREQRCPLGPQVGTVWAKPGTLLGNPQHNSERKKGHTWHVPGGKNLEFVGPPHFLMRSYALLSLHFLHGPDVDIGECSKGTYMRGTEAHTIHISALSGMREVTFWGIRERNLSKKGAPLGRNWATSGRTIRNLSNPLGTSMRGL